MYLLAMVVDIPGKGFVGKHARVVALSTDLTTVLDLSIYEQMETPVWARGLVKNGS